MVGGDVLLRPLVGNVFERDLQQEVVDVVAPEVRVAVGCEDFEDTVVELEDRDVEGSAAEVIDRDDAVLAFIESIGQRGGCGLVDKA